MLASPMLTSLTAEQNALLEVYADKWISIGLDTRPCDRPKVESLVPAFYQNCNITPPKVIMWADSPFQGIEIITKNYNISKEECFNAFCYGHLDFAWFDKHDFFHDVLRIKNECEKSVWDRMIPMMNMAQECGWFLPFEEVICLCERPEEIWLINDAGETFHSHNEKPRAFRKGRCHKDGDMAIKFRDGDGCYALNGVVMPKDIVMTPRDNIDPKVLLNEMNEEIRREIIRKIGG